MGTENLTLLLEAIKLKNKIQFTHFSYNTEKTKTVILNPYFLKEYLGRWYIVGLRDDEIRTFGIDRISNLVITKLKFEKTKSQKAKENFDSIIGLIYSEGEQQKVVLSFDPMQGRYVKSLPWHHSQKVLIDNVEELRISLYIVPNFEFYQQILMIGANVKVIEPEWLVAEIKEKLKEALGQYK
jgi:predicted DNA-binding transcriptional regulator YafY